MLNTLPLTQSRPRSNLLRILAWTLGWLLGGVALLFSWLATPVTLLNLEPGQPDNRLGLLNEEVVIQRSGFVPSAGGGFQVGPDGGAIRVTAFSFQPVTLNLAVAEGRGPLEISANGAPIGKIEGENLSGTYRFRFTPLLLDNARPEIHLQFTPAPDSGPVRLASLQLDLSEQWQPWFSRYNGVELSSLAALLGLLALAVGLGRRWPWFGWVGLAAALSGEILLANRLVHYFQLDTAGALNAAVYWGGLGATFYLMIFILLLGGFALPEKYRASVIALAAPALKVSRSKRPILSVAVFLCIANAFLTLLLFLVPVLLTNGFDSLARYWDGPEYLAIAYSLYDPNSPVLHIPHFSTFSPLYWGAHFPLVPLAIRLFSPLFGYIGAMFVLNYVFTCGFAIALYKFLRDFGYSKDSLWLTFLALFLPLRWLIYHTVGGSEPAALFFSVLCLYQFKKEKYWQAGLWGAFVVLARPNGFFLGIGLGLWLAWQALEKIRTAPPSEPKRPFLALFIERFNWRALLGLIPMPLALLAVFSLYGYQTGDFLSYLHIPENVKHIYPIPLLSLDVSVGRSEGDFYYYGLEAAGLILLWRQKRFDLFWVGLALVLPTVFLLHDDVLRYSLPAFPFVLLIPFAAVWESRPARWLAIPALLGVLIYSWSQLALNQIDMENWRELLKFIG